MSLTLSPPVRVAAFVGLLVATGLAAFVFVLGRGVVGGTGETAAPAATSSKSSTRAARSTNVAPARPRSGTAVTKSGLPPRVANALRSRRVVVVSVSMPGAAVDSAVRSQARTGAEASGAGFVPLSALSEQAMRMLFTKTGVVSTPAVVIVKRPGVVTLILGVTDRKTVEQAVAQARR